MRLQRGKKISKTHYIKLLNKWNEKIHTVNTYLNTEQLQNSAITIEQVASDTLALDAEVEEKVEASYTKCTLD